VVVAHGVNGEVCVFTDTSETGEGGDGCHRDIAGILRGSSP
jgi:hypothetical protein